MEHVQQTITDMRFQVVSRTLPPAYENQTHLQYTLGRFGFLLSADCGAQSLRVGKYESSSRPRQSAPLFAKENKESPRQDSDLDHAEKQTWYVRIQAQQMQNRLKKAFYVWDNVEGYRTFMGYDQKLNKEYVVRNRSFGSCSVCWNAIIEQGVAVWNCDHCFFKVCGDCLIEEALLSLAGPTPDRLRLVLQDQAGTITLMWSDGFQKTCQITCPGCQYMCWKEAVTILALPTEILIPIVAYAAFPNGSVDNNRTLLKRSWLQKKGNTSWAPIRLVNRRFYDIYIDIWKARTFVLSSLGWYEVFRMKSPAFQAIRHVFWSQDIPLWQSQPPKFDDDVRLNLIFANLPTEQFRRCLARLNSVEIELSFWVAPFENTMDISNVCEVYMLLHHLENFSRLLGENGDPKLREMFYSATLSYRAYPINRTWMMNIRWTKPIQEDI